MYVCHCAAVTDRAIRSAIDDGASDPVAVGQRCGAGVNCGGCLPRVCALLAEAGHPTDGLPPCSSTGMCLPRMRTRTVARARRVTAAGSPVTAAAPA